MFCRCKFTVGCFLTISEKLFENSENCPKINRQQFCVTSDFFASNVFADSMTNTRIIAVSGFLRAARVMSRAEHENLSVCSGRSNTVKSFSITVFLYTETV